MFHVTQEDHTVVYLLITYALCQEQEKLYNEYKGG